MKLETVVIESQQPASASVIWMHGLGANANDFVPAVPQLGLPNNLPIRFVFPNAPMQPVTINGGFVMRSWYDIKQSDLGRAVDHDGIRASQAGIEELIAVEIARGIPANRIVLAGFSQGGAIALHTGLCHRERLAGIVALSTYLPIAEILEGEVSSANLDVPIFMAHGTIDPVVPLTLAAKSRSGLEKAGYKIEWHDYWMPHSVCGEELVHIAAWLLKILRQ